MIDRTDFLNPVIKEKKNFEQKTIDVWVAAGLNKGIDVRFPPVIYANVVGLDRTCRIHFLHETISFRLLSPSRRSDRCSQRRPVTNFCCHRRRKLSQNTHQTPPRQYRQVHSGRLLSRSRSTVFRRNMQTHQSPQNQQRRRNQSNLVPLHSFRPPV